MKIHVGCPIAHALNNKHACHLFAGGHFRGPKNDENEEKNLCNGHSS